MLREVLDLVCGEGTVDDCQKSGFNDSDIILNVSLGRSGLFSDKNEKWFVWNNILWQITGIFLITGSLTKQFKSKLPKLSDWFDK